MRFILFCLSLCLMWARVDNLQAAQAGQERPSPPPKVLFLVPQLNLGGTEKAFIDMLQFLPPPISRYDVCILEPGGALADSLPIGPQYISFAEAQQRQYTAAVSYAQWIPARLWTNVIRAKRRIQWCHVDLSSINLFFPLMTPEGRIGIDAFVAVSETGAKSIIALDQTLRTKTRTIHNCVQEAEICQKALLPQNEIIKNSVAPSIVTVGRLSPEKGVERAIRVCKRLRDSGLQFHWYFVGTGQSRAALENLTNELQLSDCVHFLGLKMNPYPYIKAADIFALCSYSESWPLVIAEAKILHKPIVSTAFPSIYEQLCSGKDGLIVPNSEEGLYWGIRELLQNKTLRHTLQEALKDFHYDNASITKQLNDLFFSKQLP